MCGIAGARAEWLAELGREPGPALAAAVGTLAWRGPDGSGVVAAGSWWLGCARLAIGPRRSRQPLVLRGGRFAGVLNGAITNARELWPRWRPRLAAVRAPRALPNDAWLPLLAVANGDRAALGQLRGHHAYAVVDARRDQLVFGQDRCGEKPLWCLVQKRGRRWQLVAFASTPAALVALGGAPLQLERGLPELLRSGFADWLPQRVRRGLWLVPAPGRGAPFVADANGYRTPWLGSTQSSPAARATATASPLDPDREPLRDRAIAAVARCVDTASPVGLSLSGGLDSSCLAAALGTLPRAVPAFQFCATGNDPAEREVARAVAAASGLPFVPVDGGPEVLDALPALTRAAGMPLGDPSVCAVHATARAAAAQGVRVLLSGEGADECFLGYRRYRALAHLPRLPWLAPFAPRWSMRYPARLLRAASAADPAAALLEVTPPAFRDRVLAMAPYRNRSARPQPRPADPVLAARAADFAGYLRLDLLPKVDVATLAAGVEGRCPWLEGDFMAEGAERAALGKTHLRAAFASSLPDAVLQLPKRGFALPLDRWLRGDHWLLDLLAEAKTRQRPHLRPGGVIEVVDRHRRGRADLGHGLYLLAAVEIFLRATDSGRNLQLPRTAAGPPP
jgi:asparagine synthase (glutamine-hydrolysing)